MSATIAGRKSFTLVSDGGLSAVTKKARSQLYLPAIDSSSLFIFFRRSCAISQSSSSNALGT
jgi:hypothetical protein